MNSKNLSIGLSALALCATLGGIYQAAAGERTGAQLEKVARDDADKATKAIARHDGETAVRYAEEAVAARPQDAGYRALLGQAYLLAGRFGSARTALTDSLTLSPGDGKVALNLALAQIADGDWAGAHQTLDANSGSISVSDRGLALALAGDPVAAVDLMLPIARQPGADAKLRQNLALSLGLAGRWQDARMVAAMDLSPTETDKRIEEWAAFARPTGRADQVASLLGVSPSNDPGQPVALALNAPTPVVSAAIEAAPPVVPAAPAAVVAPTPAPAADPMVAPTPQVSSVVFGPRAEVVQPLPAKPAVGITPVKSKAFVKPLVAAKTTPGASTVSVGKGNYFVQLGAYDSAGVARDGWARASRVYSGFAGKAPQGMPVTVGGKTYYRLSVGGFDKAGARRLCGGYRAKGGHCFVRTDAGDKAAAWIKK